jgi:hypothetical protein
MKRFLLFLLLVMAVSAACKKPKKASQPITVETLTGNWTDELSLSSSMLPNTFSFKTDGSYTRFYGATTERGTYQVALTGTNASTLDVTFTATGGTPSFSTRIAITSRDRIIVYYNGSTAGRPFLRVP